MLDALNRFYPIRYSAMALCLVGTLVSLISWAQGSRDLITALGFCLFLGLSSVGIYDLRQTRRAILRNYPVIGHIRYGLEFIRPEIRQYFIEGDNESAPFSRSQRTIVYARAKGD